MTMRSRIISGMIGITALLGHGCLVGNDEARKRDLAITDTVQRAMLTDEEANLTRVDVYTEDAVVYLSGELAQFEQKIRAEHVARHVPGVRKVFNKIEVEP